MSILCKRVWMVGILLLASSAMSISAEEKNTEETAEEPTIEVESSNPVSGDEQAIADGRKLYVRWCQQCHGVKLDGYSPRWGHHGADLRSFWRGFGEFIAIVLNGRPEKMMPPFAEYIGIEDISKIGAFIETKAIKGANWK